ncbi:MAG: glycosyltransferase [Acidimicrobiia bacterium]|nr:glycosyltransferase [Acidimicrobiia bacterium]
MLISQQQDMTSELAVLARINMAFLQDAVSPHGGFRNRRRADGSWADNGGPNDSQGRAIRAPGSVIRFRSEAWMHEAAFEMFEKQCFISASPRANASAVLGAADVLAMEPTNARARGAMEEWAAHLRVGDDRRWPWPESRLAYANTTTPEGLLAAGEALDSDQVMKQGFRLLDWLISVETREAHFSFTTVGGWALGEPRPGFDQQPVEAAAMADACSRAWSLTGEPRWREAVMRAAGWLIGAKTMEPFSMTPRPAGTMTGRPPSGVNLNRGAESTLARLSTLHQAGRMW